MQFKVISFYRYVGIDNQENLRDEIRVICNKLKIFGRILIGKEGINACISGETNSIDKFEEIIKNKFPDLTFREQNADNIAHHRLVVRVRDEIVNFGKKADFSKRGGYISPEKLKNWFDNKRDFVLIDVRNDYETKVGKFRNAITLPIETFREFPDAVKVFNNFKNKKTVTYCTGGIRCEKASAYLKEIGFKDVYQLEGGIISYINKFPGTYFEGSCFVFDDRLVSSTDERIIISKCEICLQDSDEYINCHNLDCDKLFICCSNCQKTMNMSCSLECKNAERRRKGIYNKE